MSFKFLYPFSPAILLFLSSIALASSPADAPLPMSLQGITPPPTPGLLDGPNPIIRDKNMAIALGKALFWDTAVGSDGNACASCHFNAGADNRIKNQLAPGGVDSTLATANTFESTASGNTGGPNYTITSSDFPFFQLSNPLDPSSAVLFNTDDVMGSQGTFSGQFTAVLPNNFSLPVTPGNDICTRAADQVFHVGAYGARKVTPRNAPTVINAIFNFRSFWDGRANNVFNGSNNWGDRDPNAGVWINQPGQGLVKQRLELINSSIASLVTAPPLNITEMSCAQRTFSDLGRKLVLRNALAAQTVHYNDSVLGDLSNSIFWSDPNNLQNGLFFTYFDMIGQAFNPIYFNSHKWGAFGAPSAPGSYPYTQMEANFSMFFGLSIQLYLSTLVSDQSPFDQSPRDVNGYPTALNASELNGMQLFMDSNCSACHIGATFTGATVATNAQLVQSNPVAFGIGTINPYMTSASVVNRLLTQSGDSLVDTGFASNGVIQDGADIGLGATDPFGNPYAFSLQYLQFLLGNTGNVVDAPVASVTPCNFQAPFAMNTPAKLFSIFTQADGIIPQVTGSSGCEVPAWAYQPTPAAVAAQLALPVDRKALAVVDGVFKIPSLRNVELTGPYMHNGSMSTLDQVLEFYSRGGNFTPPGFNSGLVFINSNLAGSAQNRTDIVNFLKTLTDDRVRYQQAPFDHPSITVKSGHPGNNNQITANNPLSSALGADQTIVIPAVGAQGIATPLIPFDQTLSP